MKTIIALIAAIAFSTLATASETSETSEALREARKVRKELCLKDQACAQVLADKQEARNLKALEKVRKEIALLRKD